MIDESLTWKYHIVLVCSRISRGYYLSVQQLKQIYYNLIYPYISHSILASGSVYKTHIKKIQIKQNHTVQLIFFGRTFAGRETESAKPLLNLLDLLTVDNIYRLEVL